MITSHCLFLITLLSLVAGAGCATTSPPPGVRTEKISASGVEVRSVYLLPENAGVLIHGVVTSTTGYSSSPFRHLDVEVRGPAGELVSQNAVKFFPNPIRHSRFGHTSSSYSLRLAATPAPGSVVRVSVHPISLSECQLAAAKP
jgi:hypothetical protein